MITTVLVILGLECFCDDTTIFAARTNPPVLCLTLPNLACLPSMRGKVKYLPRHATQPVCDPFSSLSASQRLLRLIE